MRKSDKKVSSKYLVLGIIFIVTMVLITIVSNICTSDNSCYNYAVRRGQ